jgi:hypothetical protein
LGTLQNENRKIQSLSLSPSVPFDGLLALHVEMTRRRTVSPCVSKIRFRQLLSQNGALRLPHIQRLQQTARLTLNLLLEKRNRVH